MSSEARESTNDGISRINGTEGAIVSAARLVGVAIDFDDKYFARQC